MNSPKRYEQLLNEYYSGTISEEDRLELANYISNNELDNVLEEHILYNLKHSLLNEKDQLSTDQSDDILNQILSEKDPTTPKTISIFNRPFFKYGAAAAVILGVLWAFNMLQFQEKTDSSFVVNKNNVQIEYTNQSDSIEMIYLVDGTAISLHPQSKLNYPSSFKGSVREVFLEGNAFFEVASNPQKPFYVHSKHITTKVLGTSFLISIDPATGLEEVAVKTGKVEVSENVKEKNTTTAAVNAVILTPNQKAVFESSTRNLVATIVEHPQVLQKVQKQLPTLPTTTFIYEKQRLSKIFSELENNYGVTINLEHPSLGNCLFTGDLSGDDLFIQLKILSLSTQSTYTIQGTEIWIQGKGCNE